MHHPSGIVLDEGTFVQISHLAGVLLTIAAGWVVLGLRKGFALFAANLQLREDAQDKRWEQTNAALGKVASTVEKLAELTGQHNASLGVVEERLRRLEEEAQWSRADIVGRRTVRRG